MSTHLDKRKQGSGKRYTRLTALEIVAVPQRAWGRVDLGLPRIVRGDLRPMVSFPPFMRPRVVVTDTCRDVFRAILPCRETESSTSLYRERPSLLGRSRMRVGSQHVTAQGS
jgi:hypothetical protein